MRSFLALLLVIILVFPLIAAAITLLGISSWAAKREFYLDLLDDESLYYGLVEGEFIPYIQAHFDPMMGDVPPAALAESLPVIITPGYLRAQSLGIVNEVFDTIDAGDPEMLLSLDLVPIKQRLQGEGGVEFARKLAAGLPVCRNPVTAEGLPPCRPAGLSLDQFTGVIAAALPGLSDALPDVILLTGEPLLFPETWPPRFWIRRSLLLTGLIVTVIALGFWFGAAALGSRTNWGFLNWLGGSLLAPTTCFFLFGLFLVISSSTEWFRYVSYWNTEPFLGTAAGDSLLALVKQIAGKAATSFLITGGIGAGLGAGLLVWSGLVHGRELS